MNGAESKISDGKGWWRLPGVTILLTSAAVAIYLIPGWNGLLEYSRPAFQTGGTWQALTCHWSHFSFDHLIWDLIAFAWLGAFCEMADRRRFVVCTAVSALAIAGSVHLFLPEISHYRGLSGIDSALFGLLAVSRLKITVKRGYRHRSLLLGACIALFVIKVGYETMSGTTLFVNDLGEGVIPVPLAHAVGFITGALTGITRPGFIPRLLRDQRPCSRPSI